MIPETFSAINGATIESMVDSGTPEGKTLDYKRQLPDASEKTDLLRDVASFANAEGGDLIYGIDEKRDAKGPTGIPSEILGLTANLDHEIRRLRGIISSLIAPKVLGVDLKPVSTRAGTVVILRVPRSELAPHMIVEGGQTNSRFYMRTGAGNQPMDVDEIRAAFASSGDLEDRVRKFAERRVEAILLDRTPIELKNEGRLVLHIVPFSSQRRNSTVELAQLKTQPPEPMECRGWDSRFSLDGFLTYGGRAGGPRDAYVLCFRTGALEAVSGELVTTRPGERFCAGVALEQSLFKACRNYLDVLKRLEQTPPFAVFLTLVGVHGAHWLVTDRVRAPAGGPYPFDRDVVALPNVVVHESEMRPERFLRPMLDAIWQAMGWERCFHYEENGDYRA